MLLLGKHICFPSSPRYLELADSADWFIANENWIKAEDLIVKALRLEPANFSNSMLLANLGLVQARQGEYQKAINSLSLGLNIAPSSTVLLNNRAHTYLLLDSVMPAITDLDKSLQIDSLQPWTLKTRGFLYLQDNDIENATAIFSKMKKEFPKDAAVFVGFATIAEAKGNFAEAKENYIEAINLNENDEEAREAYIMVLIKENLYSDARAEIKKALTQKPENPMYYLLRGYLHRLNFRREEALADKKLAISKGIDPDYAASFIP